MKAIYLHAAGALALSFTIAACVPKVAPPVTTPPVQRPTPTPTPAPVVQAPVYDSWMDVPQTPGNWTYRVLSGSETQAYFGDASNWQYSLSIVCDRSARRIEIGRPTGAKMPSSFVIRTETATRTVSVQPGQIATPASANATLAASDPLLDAMALSKGRFAVETEGLPTLYLPSWAEISRVIEDCR